MLNYTLTNSYLSEGQVKTTKQLIFTIRNPGEEAADEERLQCDLALGGMRVR